MVIPETKRPILNEERVVTDPLWQIHVHVTFANRAIRQHIQGLHHVVAVGFRVR